MTEQVIGTSQKKYLEEYIGRVINVHDPKHLMRVQVFVESLFDGMKEKDLPWATYKLPIGARLNEGAITPVKVGDYVWIDFPFNGDSRQPRITGSVHYCPDNVCHLPDEAWKGKEIYSHKRIGSELEPSPVGYHRDTVIDQHGVLVEVVDPTGEIRVTQKVSGSAVEIDRDGNITAHSEKNLFGSSKENTELIVGKDFIGTVEGDSILTVQGNSTLDCKKDILAKAGGKAQVRATKSATLEAPTIYLSGNVSSAASDGGTATETKKANTTHTGSYRLIGTLHVDNIKCEEKITCKGNVSAPFFDGTAKYANQIG
jgi:hypothetical protein